MKSLSSTLLILMLLAIPANGQTLSDAKAAVDALGLSVSGTYLVAGGEQELSKNITQFGLLKREILQNSRRLSTMERQYAQFEQQFGQLRQQQVQLNAQLANANPNNVLAYNQLVGAINAVTGQLDLMQQQQVQMDEQLSETKSGLSKAREGIVQLILDSRQLVNDTQQAYETLNADPQVVSAVSAYATAAKRDYKLGPSTTFAANLKKLEDMEKSLESETIQLADSGGGTFHVDVIVNGKIQQKMILDSGASLVTLPLAMATQMGIKVNEDDDETIILKIANGDEINGYPKTIPSLKVGKFTVENVECVVLDSSAIGAEPLLGMSFLGNFKFELNAAEKSLSLMRLEEGGKGR
ncbi:MAG: retroviral-like aspartic protease family protein [Planctomycetaceae bacterium]|nr:retroviral-like aspartic protease family protein [Planctomycetaceae bacterium]